MFENVLLCHELQLYRDNVACYTYMLICEGGNKDIYIYDKNSAGQTIYIYIYAYDIAQSIAFFDLWLNHIFLQKFWLIVM